MNLIKRKNNWLFDPFKEFDSFFGNSFPSIFNNEVSLLNGEWIPAIDIHDEGDKLVVKAELPGLDKKSIQVAVNNDILSIKGEKKKDEKIKEENYCRTERYYGSFQRNIRLSSNIDINKVKASFKDGILELILPKSDVPKEKRINIE